MVILCFLKLPQLKINITQIVQNGGFQTDLAFTVIIVITEYVKS